MFLCIFLIKKNHLVQRERFFSDSWDSRAGETEANITRKQMTFGKWPWQWLATVALVKAQTLWLPVSAIKKKNNGYSIAAWLDPTSDESVISAQYISIYLYTYILYMFCFPSSWKMRRKTAIQERKKEHQRERENMFRSAKNFSNISKLWFILFFIFSAPKFRV